MKELIFNYIVNVAGASNWILYVLVALAIIILVMIKVGFTAMVKYKKYTISILLIISFMFMVSYYFTSGAAKAVKELKEAKVLLSEYENVINQNNATITAWEKQTKLHQEKLDTLQEELNDSQQKLTKSINKQLRKPKLKTCTSAMKYMLDEAINQ